ncbi:hypothetical protein GCM10008934_33630 [Virgibacillus salarius]
MFFFTKLAKAGLRKARIFSRCGDDTPIDNMIIRILSKEGVLIPENHYTSCVGSSDRTGSKELDL